MRNLGIVALGLLGIVLPVLSGCRPRSSGVPIEAPQAPVSSNQEQDADQLQPKPLDGKMVLFVVAPTDFRDDEYRKPRLALEDAGARIVVSSTQEGTATGVDGLQVQIDDTAGDVDPEDYDAVVFIGGPGMTQYLNDKVLAKLAGDAAEAGKITAAIGVAPAILANAGLLAGVRATAAREAFDTLKAKGTKLVEGEPAVVDGAIITCAGVETAQEFGDALVQALSKSAVPAQ